MRGIDYGRGLTNVDLETGIRYGVISVHEVTQAWYDSSEADYGDPHCPKCGNPAIEVPSHSEASPLGGVSVWADLPEAYEDFETEKHSSGDYACEQCRYLFDGDQAFGDEAIAHVLDDGEYTATQGQDGDIFVTKSPYYTRAAFCSPCAPGACYLTSPTEDGEKAYCFGHDWFDGGKAPYPVYRVSDDRRLVPRSLARRNRGADDTEVLP